MANDMNHQQQQQQGKNKQPTPPPFPKVPKAMESRVSMKWLTMEALSKVNKTLEVKGPEPRVLILTSWGQIEGKMNPIQPSMAESYRRENDYLIPDIASMVTHVRADLLELYEQEQSQGQGGQQAQGQSQGQGQKQQQQSQQQSGGSSSGLQIVDSAPIISLTDVVLTSGQTVTNLPQLTLFADQIIGFTLALEPHIH